jgi:hypothetical protein
MMRRSTGLALVAIGAILVLAVHVPLGFVSVKLTGLILMITGLAGLGAPQHACRWLRGRQDQLTEAAKWLTGVLDRVSAGARRMLEPPLPPGRRVPLEDLLRAEATARTPAGRSG